ncbi:hypothetical protein DQ04_06661020 [Trypanosoma grayi]|uniref:hypothetical protein n=1 Tax=Trypanosoma grayi TaxID=71804 RepID=UPI0004F4AA45|nr:hypothetical protein DQ04_06661020 [Trypanosoma grayi]KEG08677.1 hypothetical protein DQ04_06661020 [Trypanosoma grayi]
MLRSARWPSKGARGRRFVGWSALLASALLLSLLCFCLFVAVVDHGVEMALLDPGTGAVAAAAAGSGERPWEKPRDATVAGIGPQTLAVCRASVCRLCDTMLLHNAASVVHPAVLAYIRRHVVIGVVTGSYEKFFRVDLSLCTWMGHVPARNLFIFTDAANTSDGRHGTWIETDTTAASQRLHSGMLRHTGYSQGWMRAQYRFFHAFSHFSQLVTRGNSSNSGGDTAYRDVRWAIVVDDDTFLDLHALVRLLHRRDLSNLDRMAAAARHSEPPLLQERCGRWTGASGGEVAACIALPDSWDRLQRKQRVSRGLHDRDSEALVVGSPLWNATTDRALLGPAAAAALDPLYLGDRGWGGAGHYMNVAALRLFAQGGEEKCVQRYLIRGGLASDAALHRCVPSLGIHRTGDGVLSHCQARYLRHHLLGGDLVSIHAKRDVVPPPLLAVWRMRLYYQVLYHRNRTAYDVLMRVGACAYGYSCKLRSCSHAEDAAALNEFIRQSDNNTRVPLY